MTELNPYRPPAGDLEQPEFVPEPFTGAGQVLGKAFTLYIRNFGLLFGLVLIVFMPIDLAKNYILYTTDVSEMNAMRVDMIVGAVMGALLTPSIIFAIVEPMRTGEPTSVGQSLAYGFKRWGETFGVNFVSGFIIVLGMILLIVPGIIFALWYAFVTHVVALEDRTPKPLAHSKQVGTGHRGKMFTAYLFIGLVWMAVMVAAGIPFGYADHWLMSAALDLVNNTFIPMFTIVGLVMYVYIVHGDGRDAYWAKQVRWAPKSPPASPDDQL